LVLVNTYIHPGTASNNANWELPVQIEDELRDTVVICGDFSARSSILDQRGNNLQDNALKEPLGDVVLNPERFRYQNALVVLRILKHYLRAQSQGHHTIDRLQERGVETGSIQRSSLKGREKAIINQTNIGTVSKATLGKLPRDGMDRIIYRLL